MAVNRKLPTARLNLDPGLKRKTKFGNKATSNVSGMILNGLGVLDSELWGSHLREIRKVT